MRSRSQDTQKAACFPRAGERTPLSSAVWRLSRCLAHGRASGSLMKEGTAVAFPGLPSWGEMTHKPRRTRSQRANAAHTRGRAGFISTGQREGGAVVRCSHPVFPEQSLVARQDAGLSQPHGTTPPSLSWALESFLCGCFQWHQPDPVSLPPELLGDDSALPPWAASLGLLSQPGPRWPLVLTSAATRPLPP